MRARFAVVASIGAVIALTGVFWATAALAQSSNLTKFSGTAISSGKVSRTITDIGQPNSPDGPVQVQHLETEVSVTPGMTAAQVGLAFRDAINSNPGLVASGFSAAFDPPTDQTSVRMTRSTGSFTVEDCNSVNGLTMTVGGTLVLACVPAGVQGPLLSPWSLAILASCLSALAYREKRRRQAA
jgi:hypothetical protein